MSDMKCPFCNETELEKGIELQSGGFILGCPKCKKFARDVFWQELIRTRKALDVARNGLEYIFGYEGVPKYVHTAILKAQEMIRFPIKDKQMVEWMVEYRSGKHWVQQTFTSDDAAYAFYYTKLSEFKTQIMTQERGGK